MTRGRFHIRVVRLRLPNSCFHADPFLGEKLEDLQGAWFIKVHARKVGQNIPAFDERKACIEVWDDPRAGTDTNRCRRACRPNG